MSLSNLMNGNIPLWSNFRVNNLIVDNDTRVTNLHTNSSFFFKQIGGSYRIDNTMYTNGSIIANYSIPINGFDTGDLDKTTGIFTAPRAGKYQFNFTFQISNTTGRVFVSIVKNNQANASAGFAGLNKQMYFQYDNPATPTFNPVLNINNQAIWQNINGETVLNLAAGDTVRLRVSTSDGSSTEFFDFTEIQGNIEGSLFCICYLGN